jgi:hypothetical protein
MQESYSRVGGVTETGTVFPRYSVVAVPEDVFVNCGNLPQDTNTIMADGQYYVYGDSQTGSMQLIGEPVQGEGRWIDRGPIFTTGFTTQPYVRLRRPPCRRIKAFRPSCFGRRHAQSGLMQSASTLRGAVVLDDGQAIAAAATAS